MPGRGEVGHDFDRCIMEILSNFFEQLRQLLSEQLHEDLLDDSIATSIDGEISAVSSVQYSLSPSERVSL